jgi:plasmid stabilization system protein ParE
MFTILMTEQAEADSNQVFSWIFKNSPERAVSWFNGLVEACESLCNNPERCPVAPEADDIGREIRHLIYGRYRIIFLIRGQTVYLLHIRHGAQKPLSS